jgi:recombination DNA repair RAD52 pathway protein
VSSSLSCLHCVPTLQSNAEKKGEQLRRQREIKLSKLEQELSEVSKQYNDVDNSYYRDRDDVATCENQADVASNLAKSTKDKASRARQDLQSVKGSAGSKDRLAPYSPEIQAIYKAVQAEKGWSGFTPVGPLGLYVEPKDMKW